MMRLIAVLGFCFSCRPSARLRQVGTDDLSRLFIFTKSNQRRLRMMEISTIFMKFLIFLNLALGASLASQDKTNGTAVLATAAGTVEEQKTNSVEEHKTNSAIFITMGIVFGLFFILILCIVWNRFYQRDTLTMTVREPTFNQSVKVYEENIELKQDSSQNHAGGADTITAVPETVYVRLPPPGSSPLLAEELHAHGVALQHYPGTQIIDTIKTEPATIKEQRARFVELQNPLKDEAFYHPPPSESENQDSSFPLRIKTQQSQKRFGTVSTAYTPTTPKGGAVRIRTSIISSQTSQGPLTPKKGDVTLNQIHYSSKKTTTGYPGQLSGDPEFDSVVHYASFYTELLPEPSSDLDLE